MYHENFVNMELVQEKFEDTKWVIRRRKSNEDKQYNGQKSNQKT